MWSRALVERASHQATYLITASKRLMVQLSQQPHSTYSIYARATASRRDNLRRSADELRAHLAKAEKALLKLGEATLGVEPQNDRTEENTRRGGWLAQAR